MIDRLTERFSNGQTASYWCGSNCKYDHKYCRENLENCPAMEDIFEKLAYYEDLEEAGRLVKLPCKVGDTVYFPGERFPAEIDGIVINENGIHFQWIQYDRGYELTEVWDYGEFHIDDFGKTVFLTREEAEAALKERESE